MAELEQDTKSSFTRADRLRGARAEQSQFLALLRKNFQLKTRGALKAASVLEVVLPAIFVLALALPRALLSTNEYNADLHPVYNLGSVRWAQSNPSAARIRVAWSGISSSPADAGGSVTGSPEAAQQIGTQVWQRMLCTRYFNHSAEQDSEISVLSDDDRVALQNIRSDNSSFSAERTLASVDNFVLAVVLSTANTGQVSEADLSNANQLFQNAFLACAANCTNGGSSNDCFTKLWQPFLSGGNGARGFLDASSELESDAVSAANTERDTLAVLSASVAPGRQRLSYTVRPVGEPLSDVIEDNFPARWGAVSPPTEWTGLYSSVNVQHATEQTIASYAAEKTVKVDALVKQSPWVPYQVDIGSTIASVFLGLLLAIAFSSSSVLVVKSVVQEKELRLREGMRMMGMTDTAYWTTWLITHWSTLALSSILVTLLAIYPIRYTDPSTNLVFLLLWSLQIIAFGYVFSALFDNGRLASIATWFVYMVSIAPGIAVATVDPGGSNSWLWAAIAPASSLYMWGQLMARLEVSQRGITWSSITRNAVEEGTFTGAGIISIVIVETFLLFVLAWYLDNVWPSRFGQREHPLFIFTKRFWVGTFGRHGNEGAKASLARDDQLSNTIGDDPELDGGKEHIEPINRAHAKEPLGIYIRNLSKQFTNGVQAVDGLSATFLPGEISTLLGHNGAGKTTAFSCLTGVIDPTNGDAYMNGLSIRHDMKQIRDDLGVCPQFDTLWPLLTVLEHLRLYAAFAGVPRSKENSEAVRIAEKVNLSDKMNERAGNLSGGQRRKLSLGIAFIGRPSIVLLDEVSSGMDPSARRFAWDVIRSQKEDTTILMTTHFLDEADALSDRIAIMGAGKLAACGSSQFLKAKFGSGYQLSMQKANDTVPANQILQLVQSSVPKAEVSSNVGAELTIRIDKEYTPKFPQLINALQSQGEEVGVSSFGLSYTSLEAVFLNLARRTSQKGTGTKTEIDIEKNDTPTDETKAPAANTSNGEAANVKLAGERGAEGFHLGAKLWYRQFAAIIQKRLQIVGRDKVSFVFMLAIPLLFIVAALSIGEVETPADATYPAREITREDMLNGFRPAYGISEQAASNGVETDFLQQYHFAFSDELSRSPLLSSSNPGETLETCSCYCPTKDQLERSEYQFTKSCATEITSDDFNPLEDCTGTPTNGFLVRTGGELGENRSCVDGFEKTMDGFLLKQQEELLPCNYESQEVCDSFYINAYYDGGVIREYNATLQATFIPNPSGYFGLPVGINELNSAQFARAFGLDAAQARIVGTIHPLPNVGAEADDPGSDLLLLVALFMTLAAGILNATFSIFISSEQTNQIKHLQMVSGVSKSAYWLANWCVDFVTYLLPFGFFMLVFGAFNSQLYSSNDSLSAVAVLWLLFGWACIPLAYLLHYPFGSVMNCFVGQLTVYFFLGFAFVITGSVLQAISTQDETVADAWDAIEWIFRLLPHYCVGSGLLDIANNELEASASVVSASGAIRSSEREDPFKGEIAGYPLVFLAWEGALLLGLVIFYDIYGPYILARIRSRFQDTPQPLPEKEDEDVVEERQRVLEELQHDPKGEHSPDSVVLKNICKVYPNGTHAVKGVTVGAETSRCFGLLGVNGAGKTTTFRTITGEFEPTVGDALVRSRDGKRLVSVVNELETARKSMGYSPQYDALNPSMTVREHLRFYASIRGVPEDDVDGVVFSLMDRMHLSMYANRLATNLSGGNKRKLCVAIALIGDPPVVLLDEPSTGVDPESRRFLWDVVLDFLPGRVVVLTSHQMEECEALCHKLGIMVGGNFRCMGGLQRIKSKYGTGYLAEFKVPPDEMDALKAFVQSMPISGVSVLEEHGGRVKFHLHIQPKELAHVFAEVEGMKERTAANAKTTDASTSAGDTAQQQEALHIEEYSVSQPSLDDVFLSFAKDV